MILSHKAVSVALNACTRSLLKREDVVEYIRSLLVAACFLGCDKSLFDLFFKGANDLLLPGLGEEPFRR